ncbi:TetR/AcrR family transcriptional regulator [Rhodobacterales bacterium]|nr:TetR/AcrR family transcriptional regulator [Rhodobacterales bacterium]
MERKTDKRQRILVAARAAVLRKGFGATSIEELCVEVDITKSGFFYHFKDKNALARALLIDHMAEEKRRFDEIFDAGRDLSDDPLQAFLISLKLLARLIDDLPNGHPGCLVATYCYQERLFDREVRELNRKSVLAWRERFRRSLEEIVCAYSPRESVDLYDLADMVSAILEGGIVISRALAEPAVLSRQILLLRKMLKMLFKPDARAKAPPCAVAGAKVTSYSGLSGSHWETRTAPLAFS